MAENQVNKALSPGHPFSGERVRRIPRSADIIKTHNIKKIGTWNVRSMFQAGKAANTVKEMKRLEIDILGISEMRWPGTGQCEIGEHQIFYSGEDSTNHRNGVGIIINSKIRKAVLGFIPISDRVAILKINTSPCKLNIVQVYAPTSESDEEDVEHFYSDIRKALKQTRKEETTILMGDFNAKVGKGKIEGVMGDWGLGARNERGETLIQFCKEMEFIISNTYFKLPPRRLYTWKSPADSEENIVRNQIDFILINKRFRNSLSSVKTYPGADVPSDHNLLLGTLKIKLKKLRQRKISPRIDSHKLKDINFKTDITEHLNSKIEEVKENNNDTLSKWEAVKNIIKKTAQDKLQTNARRAKQKWMTEEILDLMEERRKFRNTDQTEYRNIDKNIRQKTKLAKENWLNEQCEEIEQLNRQHDLFNLHKKVKETAGVGKKKSVGIITDDSGFVILETEQRINRWKEYMQSLFNDESRNELTVKEVVTGPTITKSEVIYSINNLKKDKTTGPDGICGDLLKLMKEDHLDILTDLFNYVYDTGNIPDEWLISAFIPIPKKPTARKCEEYRTISLMSHVVKVFLKIVHGRLYPKLEQYISDTQFGFRNGVGTREALFSLNVLVQRSRDVGCDVFSCFIDFEKAFDRVNHQKLIEILQEHQIDDKDLRIISNLYWNQKAFVQVEGMESEKFMVSQGVRQGCVLSPLLFNVYSEKLFQEALGESKDGISINGVLINNLRYADDTVLLADTSEGLQRLIEKVAEICENYNMRLNTNKTKVMIISKANPPNGQFYVRGTPIETVTTIKYLGTQLNNDWEQVREIRIRIEKARSYFNRMRTVLCNMKLNLILRTRLLKCYVFSVLMYGVEAWTLTDAACKRLEAFELWCYRRMLRISWTHHVTNETVLQRMNKDKEIMRTVKERKLAYFGHIMRNEKYEILHLTMQGKMDGKRGPGRRRISWLHNLRQWTGKTSAELFRTAVNKVKWARLIANVH